MGDSIETKSVSAAMVRNSILSLVRLAFFTALVKGFFLWLEESHKIYVDRWVATKIGAAESLAVQAPSWVGWVVVGSVGLLAAVIWEVLAKRRRHSSNHIRPTASTPPRLDADLIRSDVSEAPRLLSQGTARDWNLSQAFDYWAKATKETGAFADELEQAASEGVVTIWGKRSHLNSAIFERIPPGHWAHSRIYKHPAVFSSSRGVSEDYISENSTTRSRNVHDINNDQYWHLRVNSSEIKQIWPTANSNADLLMPLPEAVMWAYERIRKLAKFESYTRHYDDKPEKLPSMAAQLVFNHADPPITIYGIYPPRIVLDAIPAEHTNTWRFSDDASELIDQFNDHRRYKDLRVSRSDIQRRIKDLGG